MWLIPFSFNDFIYILVIGVLPVSPSSVAKGVTLSFYHSKGILNSFSSGLVGELSPPFLPGFKEKVSVF